MSRLRAPAKNELKTRVDDDEYDALQAFREKYDIDTEAQAVRRALRIALFGVSGMLPSSPSVVSVNSGHSGPGMGR
ncbi:hypothetical protein ACQUFY_20965 [Robbsia andropogonis]|uniref:hypothetical protein n=1 Tax=Robbsia andropogonis TaxID=28092 RepID=UPI0020A1A528|nr:hypothetical protein [Robbsia andropogonis]MCP1121594.1 hypothetical protein [Robbsia andropogonis]MCP1131399.1 hypothetical protein [Robbsia andropogonis]